MSEVLAHNPIGLTIAGYQIRAVSRDAENRWIGAGLALQIPPEGTFFLEIVTKWAYARDEVEEVLENIENPAELLRDPPTGGVKEPFVLNDAEITEEILDRKFRGRFVEADLAASLWYEEAVAA